MPDYKQLLIVLLIGLAPLSTAAAGPFSQLVIFGDSLSDTGNAVEALGSLAMDPGDDYYMNRFSNGPLWVEYLATHIQAPAPVSNLLSSSGRNYAFGGANTDGSGLIGFFITDIDEQVPDFLGDGGPTGDELIVVWGGANDFRDGQTNPSTPVNSLIDDITTLYNNGGRHFMVPNLPLLGQIPENRGTADEALFDSLSTQFNTQLSTSLDNLETTLPEIQFFRVDAEALITDAIADPAALGFTNVTTPAMGLTGINADEYLFWDDIHPTTAAHKLLAQDAADVLFNALSILPGDLDFDGFVGIDDLNTILANWNSNVTPGNPLLGDPSGDGFVGIDDLNAVLGNWNAGTPPGGINVPEPAAVLVWWVMASGWVSRRPGI